MKFTTRFLVFRSPWPVKLLRPRFMQALDQTPLKSGFFPHGCCVVPTNPSERRLIWDAIGFGIAVGQVVPELFSPRWEEGWDRPITDWQDELGISEVLKTSPFQDEFATVYGFNLQ